MTSFGPDFSQLIPANSTTPNPGIHNQDGPSGTSIGGELPQSPGQIEKVGKTISGGVVRDVAVALGNVVATVGDVFDDAFNALSSWGTDVLNRFKAFFNGWFGGTSGTGSQAEVTYVIETIKDAVINGYTVTTFTSDEVAWPVPAHVECNAVLIGGGYNGSGGGGLHGAFLAMLIDLTGITSLDIQVGTAGNVSYVREADASPHTGVVVAQSPPHGTSGGIAGTFGLTPTVSMPGSGGNGGFGGSGGTAATAGQSSALATGGAAGATGGAGGPGGAGGSVSAGSQIKCGGAGGGGGGRATGFLGAGGNGGPGGYPGGGGGGYGSGWSGGANGVDGAGAPGVVWLFYK